MAQRDELIKEHKEAFGRFWQFGWVSPKSYFIPCWIFTFNYYRGMVWQIRIFGFYLASTNKKSVADMMEDIQ